MASPSLSSLPMELKEMILCCVGTPQDLFFLLRAVPNLYTSCFTASKALILSHVVENAFTPTALPDALMAIRLARSGIVSLDDQTTRRHREAHVMALSAEARVANRTSLTLDDQTTRRHREAHVVTLSAEARVANRTSLTLAESVALCQLAPSFHWLVQHSATHFLNIVQRVGDLSNTRWDWDYPSPDAGACVNMSAVETVRFYRAFLRYVSLCYMWTMGPQAYPYTRERFIEHFTSWELQELACVIRYFSAQSRDICKKIRKACTVYWKMGPGPVILMEHCNHKPFLFGEESQSSLSGKYGTLAMEPVESWAWSRAGNNLGSASFPSLRGLFEAQDSVSRLALFKQVLMMKPGLFYDGGEELFPPERFTGNSYCEDCGGAASGASLEFEGDDHKKRNFGLYWSHSMKPQNRHHNKQELRAWGFALWDKDRLDGFGFLQSQLDEMNDWSRRHNRTTRF